jgi:hypothetical protein
MTPRIPCDVPDRLVAGDTWEWTRSHADYPISDGWLLSYAFVSLTDVAQAPLEWDPLWVTDDGATWTITIPSTITAPLGEGTYRWREHVTLAARRYTPTEGLTQIESDLAEAATGSTVDETEALILKVRAEINARITGDGSGMESYQVGGAGASRAMALIPLEQLRSLLASLEAKVSRLRHPGRFGRNILSRFRTRS